MTEGLAASRSRCFWVRDAAPDYLAYHDHEWGFPVGDDHRLFEKLSLEGFQSGLSWLTILRKRENFRRVFARFDFERVARFGTGHVEKLLQDAGIVRHRGKIEATLNNARQACEVAGEFGSLAAYLWRFVGPTTMYAFSQAMGLVNDHEHACATRARVEVARRRFRPPS